MRGWSLVWLLGGCSFELSIEPRDAAIVTADAALVCGGSFSTTLAGSSSRYSISTTTLAWRAAETTCEQLGGHLFVPSSRAEHDAMRGLMGDSKLWSGVVQMPGQTMPNANWLAITGGPYTAGWQSGKPDDGGIENGGEQAGAINDNGLDDEDHRQLRPYICECDGLAVDTSIVALLPP